MVDRITREDAILQTVKEIAIAEGRVLFNNNAKPTVDRRYLLTLIREVSVAFDGVGGSSGGVHIGLPDPNPDFEQAVRCPYQNCAQQLRAGLWRIRRQFKID